MKKLLFSALIGLSFLSTSNVDAAEARPQMDCVMRVYNSSTGQTYGYALVYGVSCCSCASTSAKAIRAVM